MPDGHPAYSVTPRVLTPWRARIADGCTAFLKVVLAIGCVVSFFMLEKAGLLQAGLLVGLYFAGAFGIRLLMRHALRRRAEIVMTTDKIGVRRWFRLTCSRDRLSIASLYRSTTKRSRSTATLNSPCARRVPMARCCESRRTSRIRFTSCWSWRDTVRT